MKQYHWAVLGCGAIGNEMAQAMGRLDRTLYSVGNRTYRTAVEFSEKYGIGKVYDNPEEMFADDNVDIVYVATPHNLHIQSILKALNSGKHVLCEKSITLNTSELNQAIEAAEKNQVVLAEAMTIYHMPLYKRLKKIIESGALGAMHLAQMSFGSLKPYDMDNRFFNPQLAGGALLDIGVYALSFVRWFMSSCPDQIQSQVQFAPSGVDEQAGILLKNKESEMASVLLSLCTKQPKRGVISFEKGYIEIMEYPRGERAEIVYTEDQRRESICAGSAADALIYEILDMEAAVSGEENRMCLEYTKDVMGLMTELRREWGLIYPGEREL